MANPKSLLASQSYIDANPFDGFKIDDNSILSRLDGREPCPKCGKSRKFFCYTCYVPITKLQNVLPHVKLPIHIDIIKHRSEIDGKSTAGHAAILAPEHVSIYTYPNIPNYDEENVVLIYPSAKAISVSDLISGRKSTPKNLDQGTLLKYASTESTDFILNNTTKMPFTKAVFIDSTWNQSRSIYKDERIRKIRCVVIQNRISQFWRHQKGSPRWYLATVEAIHQFLVELHLHLWGLNPDYKGIVNCFSENLVNHFNGCLNSDSRAYNGQYDNLLYFFQHMYKLIHAYYDHDNLHAYKRRLQ